VALNLKASGKQVDADWIKHCAVFGPMELDREAIWGRLVEMTLNRI